MFGLNNRNKISESRAKKDGLRKLDKIYIGLACSLILAWILVSTGILSMANLNSIRNKVSDYFSNKEAAQEQTFMSKNSSDAWVDGNYIFYIDYLSKGVYRMDKDGSNGIKLLDKPVQAIYVQDGWIYYSTMTSSTMSLSRIRIDGTENTQIAEDAINKFGVENGYVYYCNPMGLHRISVDGSGKKTFTNSGVSNLYLYGQWIYYTDQGNKALFKLPRDGGEIGSAFDKTLVFVDNSAFGIYKNYAYYISGGKLYKAGFSSQESEVVKDNASSFYIDDDILYYTMNSKEPEPGDVTPPTSRIFSSDLRGNNAKELFSEQGGEFVYLRDGIVYFKTISPDYPLPAAQNSPHFKDLNKGINIGFLEPELKAAVSNLADRIPKIPENYSIHKFGDSKSLLYINGATYHLTYMEGYSGALTKQNKNSAKSEVIADIPLSSSIDNIGNLIFYTIRSDSGNALYCMDTNRKNKTKVFDFDFNNYAAGHDGIYFTDPQSKLYRYEYNGGKIIKLSNDRIERFLLDGNYIYYTPTGSKGIYRIKSDGSEKKQLLEDFPYYWDVCDGYIFYASPESNPDGNFEDVYKTKIGSKNREAVIKCIDGYFSIKDGYIYFKNRTDYKLARADLSGKNIVKSSIITSGFAVMGDYIYLSLDEGGYSYKSLPLSKVFK